MYRNILVALLETVVLLDVVQVVPPDDDGMFHLHFSDNTSQDATTDRHFAGEGAFLVNVVTLASLQGILYVSLAGFNFEKVSAKIKR